MWGCDNKLHDCRPVKLTSCSVSPPSCSTRTYPKSCPTDCYTPTPVCPAKLESAINYCRTSCKKPSDANDSCRHKSKGLNLEPTATKVPLRPFHEKRSDSARSSKSSANKSTNLPSKRKNKKPAEKNRDESSKAVAPNKDDTSNEQEPSKSTEGTAPVEDPAETKEKEKSADAAEHEYIHFLLNITEDILRNNIYKDKDLDKLFESHIEANKARLKEDRMRQQIETLKKELHLPLPKREQMCECHEKDASTTDDCKCCPGYETSSGTGLVGKCMCNNPKCPGRELSKYATEAEFDPIIPVPTNSEVEPFNPEPETSESNHDVTNLKKCVLEQKESPCSPQRQTCESKLKQKESPCAPQMTESQLEQKESPCKPETSEEEKLLEAGEPQVTELEVKQKESLCSLQSPVQTSAPELVQKESPDPPQVSTALEPKESPCCPQAEEMAGDSIPAAQPIMSEQNSDTKFACIDPLHCRILQKPHNSDLYENEPASKSVKNEVDHNSTPPRAASLHSMVKIINKDHPQTQSQIIFYNAESGEHCYCTILLQKTALKIQVDDDDMNVEYILVDGPVCMPRTMLENKTIPVLIQNVSSMLIDSDMNIHSKEDDIPSFSRVNLYQQSNHSADSYDQSNNNMDSVSAHIKRMSDTTPDYDLTPERDMIADVSATPAKGLEPILKKCEPKGEYDEKKASFDSARGKKNSLKATVLSAASSPIETPPNEPFTAADERKHKGRSERCSCASEKNAADSEVLPACERLSITPPAVLSINSDTKRRSVDLSRGKKSPDGDVTSGSSRISQQKPNDKEPETRSINSEKSKGRSSIGSPPISEQKSHDSDSVSDKEAIGRDKEPETRSVGSDKSKGASASGSSRISYQKPDNDNVASNTESVNGEGPDDNEPEALSVSSDKSKTKRASSSSRNSEQNDNSATGKNLNLEKVKSNSPGVQLEKCNKENCSKLARRGRPLHEQKPKVNHAEKSRSYPPESEPKLVKAEAKDVQGESTDKHSTGSKNSDKARHSSFLKTSSDTPEEFPSLERYSDYENKYHFLLRDAATSTSSCEIDKGMGTSASYVSSPGSLGAEYMLLMDQKYTVEQKANIVPIPLTQSPLTPPSPPPPPVLSPPRTPSPAPSPPKTPSPPPPPLPALDSKSDSLVSDDKSELEREIQGDLRIFQYSNLPTRVFSSTQKPSSNELTYMPKKGSDSLTDGESFSRQSDAETELHNVEVKDSPQGVIYEANFVPESRRSSLLESKRQPSNLSDAQPAKSHESPREGLKVRYSLTRELFDQEHQEIIAKLDELPKVDPLIKERDENVGVITDKMKEFRKIDSDENAHRRFQISNPDNFEIRRVSNVETPTDEDEVSNRKTKRTCCGLGQPSRSKRRLSSIVSSTDSKGSRPANF